MVDRAGGGNDEAGSDTRPGGKTRYTAEEFRALLEGLPPATDDDTTILRGSNGRRATREEMLALYEELMARPRPGG